jgi:hypothetical protein
MKGFCCFGSRVYSLLHSAATAGSMVIVIIKTKTVKIVNSGEIGNSIFQ